MPPHISTRLVAGCLALLVLAMFGGSFEFLEGGSPWGDDNSAHLALAVHISQILQAGETDLFWSHSNLGLPLYMAYQPLPSLYTGGLMAMLPSVDPVLIFKLVIVLLWSTMPLTWYFGARWYGANRERAVLIAMLILAPRDMLDMGLTITSTAYTGLFTQLFGIWLFPLAVGALERSAIRREMWWPTASFLVALTTLCHLFFGLLVALALAASLLSRPREITSALPRVLLIGVAALALCAFWLVPLVLTRDYVGGLPWPSDEYLGWSPTRLTKAILGGDVLDKDRFPWLTLLALPGLVWVFYNARQSAKTRTGLIFGGFCLVLMGGRAMWGDLYNALPMHQHVNPSRYLVGIQICAVVLAATWIPKLWHRKEQGMGSLISPHHWRRLVISLSVLVTASFALDRHFAWKHALKTFDYEEASFSAVTKHLAKDKRHRFAVDADLDTASHFHRDLLPMLADRDQLQSYALGYHATFSTYYAEYIRYDTNWMRLFNVGALVARNNGGPIAGRFEPELQAEPYTVFRVPGAEEWGYFDIVSPGPKVSGNLRDMRSLLRHITPLLFSRGYYLSIDSKDSALHIDGVPWQKTMKAVRALPPTRAKARVLSEERGRTHFSARIDAEESAGLMLKVNYFPYWNATIDGEPAEISHVAPNFMVVQVPPGKHDVEFRYQNPLPQKIGAAASALAFLTWLVALPWVSWRRRREN